MINRLKRTLIFMLLLITIVQFSRNKKKRTMKYMIINCIRKILVLNLILISTTCFIEVGEKQYMYIDNIITHKKMVKEIDKYEDIQEYLYDKPYDWITVSETIINYPLMTPPDNNYYLTRDFEGNYNKAGSIFYDSTDQIYNGNLTVIYGHCMRDGSQFGNLHYFHDDIDRFNKSKLTISNIEGDKTFIPLGFMTYASNNPFYRDIDNLDINDAVNLLKEDCKYINNITPKEDSHIIALITCEYSQDNGRLVVFYISE